MAPNTILFNNLRNLEKFWIIWLVKTPCPTSIRPQMFSHIQTVVIVDDPKTPKLRHRQALLRFQVILDDHLSLKWAFELNWAFECWRRNTLKAEHDNIILLIWWRCACKVRNLLRLKSHTIINFWNDSLNLIFQCKHQISTVIIKQLVVANCVWSKISHIIWPFPRFGLFSQIERLWRFWAISLNVSICHKCAISRLCIKIKKWLWPNLWSSSKKSLNIHRKKSKPSKITKIAVPFWQNQCHAVKSHDNYVTRKWSRGRKTVTLWHSFVTFFILGRGNFETREQKW